MDVRHDLLSSYMVTLPLCVYQIRQSDSMLFKALDGEMLDGAEVLQLTN